jgi:hypothetical protein
MTKETETMVPNETKNQHFVAQGVQSLNALPSENGKISHINTYERVDEVTISLVDEGTRPIRKNLSLEDLYSFDIEGRLRRNYETLFHQFESDVPERTLSVVEKVRAGRKDIDDDVWVILRAKFMDFVRNPYNIRTCLKMFPQLAASAPTSGVALELYNKVLSGNKPHLTRICKILSITPDDYQNWLTTMFVLLYPIPGIDEPLLDKILDSLASKNDYVCGSHVIVYDNPAVLLSDRAANFAIESESNLSLEFHASAHMLITLYVWKLDNVSDLIKSTAAAKVDLTEMEALIRRYPELMPAAGITVEGLGQLIKDYVPSHNSGFEIRAEQNVSDFVVAYNRRAVEQCKRYVYGCAEEFPGVNIRSL